jgi:hypothetical protein
VTIALLKLAQENSGGATGNQQSSPVFGQEIIASVYLDWLDNEAEVKSQPLDRDKARNEVETLLASALKSDNYNGELLAQRGMNLAWLNKPQEADDSLQKSLKYVASSDQTTLNKIKQAYDKLDMKDKSKLVQDKLDKARTEALQKQLQQAIAQQQGATGGGLGGAPIRVPANPGAAPIKVPVTPPKPSAPTGNDRSTQ